jgi:DNA repair protein RecO (recombination protein O)
MDTRVSDQPAFALHRRAYQESSLILDLLTRDYGRISLLARGARSRRNVAQFEIASVMRIGWSGRGDLKNLTTLESHPLTIPPQHTLGVFYLNELLLFLLPARDPYPGVFDLYQATLVQMASHPLEPLLRAFELAFLRELGLMPDLAVEADSGNQVEPDRRYRLLPQTGVLPTDNPLPGDFSGAALRAIDAQQFDLEQYRADAKRLMRAIIDFNLQGRELQSRKLYQQMMPGNHDQ